MQFCQRPLIGAKCVSLITKDRKVALFLHMATFELKHKRLIKSEEAWLFSRLYLAIIRALIRVIVPVQLGPCLGASSIGVSVRALDRSPP